MSCEPRLNSSVLKILRAIELGDSIPEAALVLVKAARARLEGAEAIVLLRKHLENSPSQSVLIELLGLQLNGLNENFASSLAS